MDFSAQNLKMVGCQNVKTTFTLFQKLEHFIACSLVMMKKGDEKLIQIKSHTFPDHIKGFSAFNPLKR